MSNVDPTDLYRRVRILEGQVQFLAKASGVILPGVEEVDLSNVPPDVIELARAGRTMDAVKRFREVTGCGLAEATQVVDSIA